MFSASSLLEAQGTQTDHAEAFAGCSCGTVNDRRSLFPNLYYPLCKWHKTLMTIYSDPRLRELLSPACLVWGEAYEMKFSAAGSVGNLMSVWSLICM